jgi:hypothetical protein
MMRSVDAEIKNSNNYLEQNDYPKSVIQKRIKRRSIHQQNPLKTNNRTNDDEDRVKRVAIPYLE